MNLQRLFLVYVSLAVPVVHADNISPPSKPALTVSIAQPKLERFTATFSANGNIAAWQEAIIGTEVNGLRLQEVLVNVGDSVKAGQVLATFATDTVSAEIEQIKAAVAEAEANAKEAELNAQRAAEVSDSGALSAQKIDQYLSARKTAQAKLQAQRAALKIQELRLDKTQVRAPDAGVISARSATLGAVLPNGQELFRLLRQNRLEWRAEVPASELVKIHLGGTVKIVLQDGSTLHGKVRSIAPTVNADTRLGLVYVDIPSSPAVKAGMFMSGEFLQGEYQALTIPQQALVARDGFNYIFRVDAEHRVSQEKVQVGRHHTQRVEIQSQLSPTDSVVVSGAGFLNNGDLINIAPASTPSQ